MARKLRRQHVTLRFKRREALKGRVRTVVVRSVAVALLVGFGFGLVAGRDSIFWRFIQHHTPEILLNSPKALASLPAMTEVPSQRFWLWVPGSGTWLKKRICRKYNAVRTVRLDRRFRANRVVLHLEPRVPLVTWNGLGFDGEGALFAIIPGTWNVLPQANFSSGASKPELGRWLTRLAAMPVIWSQVATIKQDPSGNLELGLKTYTAVVWGPPESEPFTRKAQTLARVLDDAHHNLSGAARADLRFFDQGRIIVLPKGK